MDRERREPRLYLIPGSPWYKIDLRLWRLGRMTMRNPADSGWPTKGSRTASLEVAESWVTRYLRWAGDEELRRLDGFRPEMRLEDAIAAHLEHRASVVERATLSCDRTAMNILKREFYAGTRVGEITTAELQQVADSMLRAGYKQATLATYFRFMGVMFERLTGRNPTERLFLGVQARATPIEAGAFGAQQITDLFEAARSIDAQRIGQFPSAVLACALGLYMGLRQGEIFALQWADIDPFTKTVRVRFQVPKDRLELVATKGKWARTSLVLPGWWEHHRADRVGFICGRQGRPVGTRTQRNLITRVLDTAKLNRLQMGWHILRHTYALNFLDQGGSMEQLQKSLGHSSIVTTQTTYDHFREDIAAAAARRSIYGTE